MYEFCLPTTEPRFLPARSSFTRLSTTVIGSWSWQRQARAPDHARGYDWTKGYPWITEAARKVRQKRFVLVLDGEAVILGVDGLSDLNALHSGKHNEEVQLCAFDILAEGDDDLRKLPLHLRKANLERLLARRPEGIFVNPFERGEIGVDLFRAACAMGLEGGPIAALNPKLPSIGRRADPFPAAIRRVGSF